MNHAGRERQKAPANIDQQPTARQHRLKANHPPRNRTAVQSSRNRGTTSRQPGSAGTSTTTPTMRAGSQPHGEPGAALTTHQESATANHAPANRQLSPPAIQPEPGCNQQPIVRAGESREHPPIQHAPTTHQETTTRRGEQQTTGSAGESSAQPQPREPSSSHTSSRESDGGAAKQSSSSQESDRQPSAHATPVNHTGEPAKPRRTTTVEPAANRQSSSQGIEREQQPTGEVSRQP